MPVFRVGEVLSFSAKGKPQVLTCGFLLIILCFCSSKLCKINKS